MGFENKQNLWKEILSFDRFSKTNKDDHKHFKLLQNENGEVFLSANEGARDTYKKITIKLNENELAVLSIVCNELTKMSMLLRMSKESERR